MCTAYVYKYPLAELFLYNEMNNSLIIETLIHHTGEVLLIMAMENADLVVVASWMQGLAFLLELVKVT